MIWIAGFVQNILVIIFFDADDTEGWYVKADVQNSMYYFELLRIILCGVLIVFWFLTKFKTNLKI